MVRTLLLFLVAASLAARASDPISVPAQAASDLVKQTHVTAELIPEKTTIAPGEPFDVALHLHTDAGWHTYWINPGDAGLATKIKWTLPPGFTAGPIQWPTPEKHKMGPLVTYGYEGDVYLLTTITPPKTDLPQHFDIKARADWLVCQEECIPGRADLTLTLDSGLLNLRLPIDNKDFFIEARKRLPAPNTMWEVKGAYAALPAMGIPGPKSINGSLQIMFKNTGGERKLVPDTVQFFPEQANVLDAEDQPSFAPSWPTPHEFSVWVALQQNGEKPEKISGVLVADRPLIGDAKSVYLSEFPVAVAGPRDGSASTSTGDATAPSRRPATATESRDQTLTLALPTGGSTSGPTGSGTTYSAGSQVVYFSSPPDNKLPWPKNAAPPLGTAAATEGTADGHRPPLQTATAPSQGTATVTTEAQPLLIAVLGAAFLGGLILNLMPCVLPVLSLKVFSLMKHAGDDPRGAWKQGAAFTVGVVLSFWVLAGLLLALRAAGNQLGWGFQMQSPGFVLALIFLFFLLALNLFGVFELGTSLVGLDAKATGRFHGLTSSFLNGALATLAATPCTAPFMGGALGFAAQQPPFVAMVIFTFLALGMATPYLLLTIFPGALRFVPKPGAWMEAFRQFMGFLLMATVIWLVYVFGALVGEEKMPLLLFLLLLVGMAAWIYGKWGWFRTIFFGLALVLLPMAFGLIFSESGAVSMVYGTFFSLMSQSTVARRSTATTDGYQPWSQSAVDDALAQGRPVFVDFTAAWCLSCKVNEQVALETDAVKQAFAAKNVALLKADWTHADPAISAALQKYNRDGVPLYLLYSSKDKDNPQILPAVLTPGIVLEAVGKL